MAVRKIPLEGGGYIKFENDEEYYEWLQQQEELRRQKQEEAEEKEKIIGAFKIGCFVIVLIVFCIIGFCSSDGQKKEKKSKETFRTEKKINKTSEQTEQNTYVIAPIQAELISPQPNKEIMLEPEVKVVEEISVDTEIDTEYEESEGIEELMFEEDIEPDFSGQKIYQSVEIDEEPKFPGGVHALMEYIADNVIYPQTAIDEGVQGRVLVRFVVEPNGKVTNVEVLQGIGAGCDEEAIRVVKSLPDWEPGVKRGESVRVAVFAPIRFAFE